MTVYTTLAIATNAIGNTVTVASADNMVSGMPITFSGNVFGDIISGATYYIGNIAFGYPTSTITLTSLPGVGQYALATDTGSMTGTFSSGGQQIIPTTSPGVPLGTAFTYVNTNFDQVFAAGPVGSNVQIKNNTIYTLNTNGNLTLNPNGIGNVMANASINPAQDRVWSLGSPTLKWQNIYTEYSEISNANISSITIPVSNLHILGGNVNDFLKTDGNGNLSWALPVAGAGGDNTQIQYNNNNILDGSNTFTFNSNTSTVTIQNVTTLGVANLNNVSNVQIAGGIPGYVLQTDGAGNLSWTAPTGNVTGILDQQFYGDGISVDFNLITTSVTNAVVVSINGVLQIPVAAYTVASDVITFSQPPGPGDLVDIRFLVFGLSSNNTPGGANGFIQFNSGNGFGGSGNLRYYADTGNLYSANISVSGNVTAAHYYGDGSHLTGITATANTGNITFANNVVSTSDGGNTINIIGPQQTPVSMATGGNSATSQLLWATDIAALAPEDLFNGVINGNTWGSQISAGNTGVVIASNSAAGLQTWTFDTAGTLSSTGSISAGRVSTTGNITANVDVSAVGNISGTYIFGNVAFANGIPATYGNSNVANYLNGSIGNVIPVANISYSLGNINNWWADLWVSNINGSPYGGGGGNANTGNITFSGTTMSGPTGSVNQYSVYIQPSADYTNTLQILPTADNDIHLFEASGNAITLGTYGESQITVNGPNSANAGITVQSNGNVWTFGADGGTVFPTLTTQRGDNPSGTISGQTLLFGDGTQEAVISTPDAPSGSNGNSQRLVINPGAGDGYGEGGDIYLWAGRGGNTDGNGGDVKIRGGQGVGNGPGGYLRIEAGDTQGNGTPGYIDITGGQGGNTAGGYVNVTGGQGATVGGNVKIYGGYGQATGGNVNIWGGASGNGQTNEGHVNIQTGGNTWTFAADGNLTVPGNILGGGNILIAPDSASASAYLDIYLTYGPDIHIAGNSENVIIGRDSGANITVGANGDVVVRADTGTVRNWTFSADGNLNLPQGGWIGAAGVKGDGTMLTGGTGNIASLTSFYADAPGIYSSCLTANPDGTLNITAYGNGAGQLGQWRFSGYDVTVPGDILAQEGNDLAVQVFNPTSIGGVTYVVQNRQVDLGNARTTQFEVAPANIILSTDFSGNRYQWTFGSDASLLFPQAGNVTAAIDYVADDEISFGTSTGNISIWPGAGRWIFDTTGNLAAPGDISAVGNVYATNIVAEAPFEIQVYDFAANIGGRYGVDTQTNTVTATLPAAPPLGGAVFFADAAGAYNILNLIINPNGQTIMGTPGNMTVSTPNQSVGLFWNGTTWRIYNAG